MSSQVSENWRKPEDFLELVERMKAGRLKVYLGYAAGVGKTYQMLCEARQLKSRGVDIVLGFIETHRRAETAAQVGDLPMVPTKKVEYRDIILEEMDVDGVIVRKPDIVVVDEVAHTNAPGLKNRRRYQDVLDILAAGINVICAFNIQHLESLNDLVERTTGIRVRETVPDVFLKRADQIVTVDLSVEDLHDRLKSGKIYTADKIHWALEHFFKSDNLSTLRELALREVAENLDSKKEAEAVVTEQKGKTHSAGIGPGVGRVMVCMTSRSPRAKTLLRRGSRLAGRLNTHWYLVYVETQRESSHLIDSESLRRLTEVMQMADELGAEVVRLKSNDPVVAIIDFARSHNVRHLIVGSSKMPRWKQWYRRPFLTRLLDEAEGIDVTIVAFDDE
ncbi:MAG: universal stress protein [Planctomycetaceae bacterium]|nr:universal stress protein [Planctomycetaceae bacterium]